MNTPANYFHKLIGDRKNYYSVTVQANWKLIFTFENGHAQNVNYLDYH